MATWGLGKKALAATMGLATGSGGIEARDFLDCPNLNSRLMHVDSWQFALLEISILLLFFMIAPFPKSLP